MVYRGHIRNGVPTLDEPITLPEGAEVRIEVVELQKKQTLAERLKDVIGAAKTLPADAAKNHDHYLYGTPKK